MENRQTAPRARGNAPLSPPAAVLPPKGEVLAALDFVQLMKLKRVALSKSPPPRGRRRHRRQKGCISSGEARLLWFSRRCCHKLKLPEMPSTHSPTAEQGEGGGASRQKGESPEWYKKHMTHSLSAYHSAEPAAFGSSPFPATRNFSRKRW